ncbi:unnamed protein product [Caretta caretta]
MEAASDEREVDPYEGEFPPQCCDSLKTPTMAWEKGLERCKAVGKLKQQSPERKESWMQLHHSTNCCTLFRKGERKLVTRKQGVGLGTNLL